MDKSAENLSPSSLDKVLKGFRIPCLLAVTVAILGSVLSGCSGAKMGRIEPLDNIPLPPTRAQMTLLRNGHVLLLGDYPRQQGEDWNKKGNALIDFDPQSKSFQIVGKTLEQRQGSAMAQLPDGNVLIAGGFSDSNETKDSTEFFNPKTRQHIQGPPMLSEHAKQKAIVQKNGDVWFFGGRSTAQYLVDQKPHIHTKAYKSGDIEKFLFQKNVFTLGAKSGIPAHRLEAISLKDGDISLTMGDMGATALELYNPVQNKFIFKTSLKYPFVWVGQAELQNGLILLYGPTFDEASRRALIFNPKTFTFTDAAPLEKIISPHTSVTLNDGRVLISGRVSVYDQSEALEIYNPKRKHSSVLRLHKHGFNAERMVKLPDGRVFLTGLPGKGKTTAELYIPEHEHKK